MATAPAEQNIMRLTYREKVPVSTMKEIILTSLQERLTGAQYEGDKCNESAKALSDIIRSRLKNLGFQRYKFVVQVVIGERREQGIRYAVRDVLFNFLSSPLQHTLRLLNSHNVHDYSKSAFRMGTRCFWDSGSDNSASETFMNVSDCTCSVIHDSSLLFALPSLLLT